MKRGLFMVCLVAVLCVFVCFMSVAFADTVHHTITFHSGDGGLFSDGTDVHVVEYGDSNTEDITMISHTSNVADDGTLISGYGNQWDIVNVVTIPNASFLNVTFRYGTASSGAMSDTEYACVWIGNHPSYKAATDFSLSYTGKLTGNSDNPNNVKHYMFRDQSVTFGFRSNRVAANDPRYGYHAVVTFPAGGYFLANDCVYEDPIPSLSGWKLVGWSTSPDGSGTMYENPGVLSETMDLYAVYEEDVVASGTYRNVDWKFRKDGVLFIGDENEEQTFAYVDPVTGQAGANYPWYKYRASIINVVFSNKVYGTSSMQGMFEGCAFSSIDLTNFDTSQVINFNEFFSECRALTSLDATQFDLSSGERFGLMFEDCVGLTTINIDNWDMSCAKDLGGLFEGCTNLTSLNVSNWNISSAEYLGGMFRECSKLATIDVSRWDTSNVKNMSYMFYKCSKLTTIDVSDWDTSSVTNMGGMFGSCSQLTTVDVSNFDTSNVTDFSSMFSNCTRVVVLDVSQWDTSSAIDMNNMFYYCGRVEVLDVSNFDVSHVEKAYAMFHSCSLVKELDVSNWDLSHIVESQYNPQGLCYMFSGCSGLTSLDLSNWDPSTVKNFAYMFYGCRGLLELDLSSWNTPVLQRTASMFENCASLESLNLQNFDTTQMNSATNMFKNCSKLAEITFGENYHFLNASTTLVPTPPARYAGILYTQKWIREDKAYGPYTPAELATEYDSSMAGKWVWERAPMEYTLNFVPPDDTYVGSMPQVKPTYSQSYVLPENAFALFGYVFDHWDDGGGHTYVDQDTIPANTYAIGTDVILTAIFIPVDTSVVMHDGTFDFTLKADEKALFIPVPASTSYQVYEQTPFGWNLIKQVGNAGVIEPDEESEALFLNKYDPLKATVRFVGTKLMDESVAEAETFSFLLYEDDTLVDIATVGDAGVIEFQPITYDQAGVHNYTIQEVIGNDNSVEYDTHVESIVVTVESDGAGHLSVDISMDEDEILFENKSKPGLLALRKAGMDNTDESREGMFYYEVQFVTQNGQPYELASSEISYEEREGDISEFPEVQPLPEKPEYLLTVNHYRRGSGLQPEGSPIVTNQTYHAGDIVTVNAVRFDAGSAQYVLSDVDSGAVRVSDGCYKFLMPNHDITLTAMYDRYTPFMGVVIYSGKDVGRPGTSIDIYGNGRYIDTLMYESNASSYSDYILVPLYDTDGSLMEYDTIIDVPEDYCLRTVEKSEHTHRYFLDAGYQGHVLWEDYDNQFNTRPESVSFKWAHFSYRAWASSNYVWEYLSTREDYRIYKDESVFDVNVPDGYMLVSDYETGPRDIKLKLVSRPVSGSITWADDNNSAGTRPESVIVHVMQNGVSIDSQTITESDNWQYSFIEPVVDEHGQLAEYIIAMDPVSGYRITVDENDITAEFASATISGAKWLNQINASNTNSLPLRLATTFTRNRTYASVDELPVGAIKIDDGRTSFSIYFWMDGTDAKWWSDAELVYAGQQGYMFYGCANLTELDLSEWDTSKLTGLQSMFYNCSGLISLNLTGWDTSNVTYFNNMFYNCSNLTSLDVSEFDTSSARSLKSMFAYCKKLTSLDLSNFNTTNVTDLNDLFMGCEKLQSIDMTGWNTANVTDMSGMFYNCQKLPSVNIAHFNTSSVTKMSSMFGYCYELIFVDVSGWDMSHVTTLYNMFFDCTKLPSLNVSSWNTASVTNMTSVFHYCYKLADLDVSGWNTSNVTSMKQMFYACHELTSLDLSGWDTSSVTNMNAIFGGGCNGLTSLNLSGWDTSAVTDMAFMFDRDSSLTELDLSSFDTSKVVKMGAMFQTCSHLEKVYVSDLWVTDAVEDDGSSMFAGAGVLVGGNGTLSNSYYVDVSRAHIDGGEADPGYFTYKARPVDP